MNTPNGLDNLRQTVRETKV